MFFLVLPDILMKVFPEKRKKWHFRASKNKNFLSRGHVKSLCIDTVWKTDILVMAPADRFLVS